MKQNPPIFMVVWLIDNQQLPTSASQRQYVYTVTQTSINWMLKVKIPPHMRYSLSFQGNIKSKIDTFGVHRKYIFLGNIKCIWFEKFHLFIISFTGNLHDTLYAPIAYSQKYKGKYWNPTCWHHQLSYIKIQTLRLMSCSLSKQITQKIS